jgi:exonuclease SbcC
MVTVSELDAKALEVLEAVYENGGEANTPEIKEYTGIQKSGIIHYRYEKLQDAGLIETRTGEPEGTKMPPTVASLTEKAEKEISAGLFGEEGATVVERMDRLERQYRQAVEALREVQRDFERWRFDPETDEEIGAWEIAERIEDLEELTETIEERHEEVAPLPDVVDTVDWTERVIQDHSSQIAAIEDRLDDLEQPADDIREEVERISENQQELSNSLATVLQEARDAKEEAESAREEARDLARTLPDKPFLTRLSWLLFGGPKRPKSEEE